MWGHFSVGTMWSLSQQSPSCHGNLVSVLVWGSVAVINIMTETNLVEEFILFTG